MYIDVQLRFEALLLLEPPLKGLMSHHNPIYHHPILGSGKKLQKIRIAKNRGTKKDKRNSPSTVITMQ